MVLLAYTNMYATVHRVKTMDEFNSLLAQGKPVAIDVSASWCGPCKTIKPLFEELAAEYVSVIFVEVDGDNSATNGIKSMYNVTAYPTFVFLDSTGNKVDRFSGGNPDRLRQTVAKLAQGRCAVPEKSQATGRVQAYEKPRAQVVTTPATDYTQLAAPSSEKKLTKKMSKKNNRPKKTKRTQKMYTDMQ